MGLLRTHDPRRSSVFAGLAALAAIAAALLAPGHAGAKLLVSTYNEGLEPHAVLQGHTRAMRHPRQMRVEISGAIQAEVNAEFTIRCDRKGARSSTRHYKLSGMSPAQRLVPISARWDQCRVTEASARYDDPFVEGWIQIRAWGTPR